MKPFVKLGYFAAACALLVATFSAIGPRAVRAAAATMVQIVNTAATPAITQDVSKLASQNVELNCSPTCAKVAPDAVVGSTFTVPTGQHLVISTVQLDVSGGGLTGLSQTHSAVTTSGRTNWLTYAAGTYQYQYPSGIVIPEGTTLAINGTVVSYGYIYGYLTSN